LCLTLCRMELFTDAYFMDEALREAQRAADAGEIPVGAVVVCGQRIIARGRNQTELLHDVTAHAEIIAITAAAEYLGAKYLPDCTLYVTLEPCVMCAGALYWAQLGRVVYGADDEKRGFGRLGQKVLHPKTTLTAGVREEECRQLLLNFFRRLRT
jgi:tRNA(adenine34) deaminase